MSRASGVFGAPPWGATLRDRQADGASGSLSDSARRKTAKRPQQWQLNRDFRMCRAKYFLVRPQPRPSIPIRKPSKTLPFVGDRFGMRS